MMMKNIRIASLWIIVLVALVGCLLDEDVAEQYKKETPLEIDIQVPEYIEAKENTEVTFELSQNGESVSTLDDLSVTTWMVDSETTKQLVAENVGNGEYSVETSFDQDGIYHMKVTASKNNATIMPTKQFIVGNYEEEVNEPTEDEHEGHDHDSHH